MAEGHGWGGAPPVGFQPPRAGFRQRCPSLSKTYQRRGAFSRTNVVVFSSGR
jgi:hypothetical protein